MERITMKKIILHLIMIITFLLIVFPGLSKDEENTCNYVRLTILNDTLYAIDLDGNGYSFPTFIYRYDSCKILRMTGSYYNEIPSTISKMNGLEEILINKCYNLDFDKSIQNLSKNNILKLTLVNDSLKEIPKSIEDLQKLQKLNLSGNQISIVPNYILSLPNLKVLYLNNNRIKTFEIKEFNFSIENLDISENELDKLPEGIKYLKNLRFLTLVDNKNLDLKEICDVLPYLENLEMLNIIGCKKAIIPDNIDNLKYVKKRVETMRMFSKEEIELLRSKGIKI